MDLSKQYSVNVKNILERVSMFGYSSIVKNNKLMIYDIICFTTDDPDNKIPDTHLDVVANVNSLTVILHFPELKS